MKMKLISASVALTAVLSATSLAAAQDGGEQTCVVGAFALEFDGACTAEAIVAAYADQVFDAPGARSPTCAADAETDLNAKLDAAGLSGAAALCDQVYAAQDRVPFTDAAKRGTDLHFERMFYNGRTDWQEEVETLYETEDQTPTSVLEDDAVQVRTFYRGIAQGRRVEWPGALSNFRSSVTDADDLATCTTNAAMCCWPKDRQAGDNNGNCATPYDEECVDKDPADNTDLCFVDLERGNESTGFDSTDILVFPEDNDDGEGAVHCHGIAWSNDVNHHTARYKANNLFFVSMYDHMYQRGYVQNIPGAPMCGCVEQMPTVSRSDCTQIDIAETIRITYDPEAVTPFDSKLTHVDVEFNSCQGTNNRNNDLWAYIDQLYYQGHVTPKQFSEAGRIITDNGCTEAIQYELHKRELATGYDHDVATWTHVAGRDALRLRDPFGHRAFARSLTAFEDPFEIYGIVYRVCATCISTHQKIFYRRRSPVPEGFDLLDNILYRSDDGDGDNVWSQDFSLHSTLEDAFADVNPWKCPDDSYDYNYAFYGRCSPDGTRISSERSRFDYLNDRKDVAYFTNKAEEGGLEEVPSTTIKGRAYARGVALRDPADEAIYMTGAGQDIWWIEDDFNFMSESADGDRTIVVHAGSVSNPQPDGWSKAGIMFRAGAETDAPNYLVYLSGSFGVCPLWRYTTGAHSQGGSCVNSGATAQTEAWLKVEKRGDSYTSFVGWQEDEAGTVEWTVLDSREIPAIAEADAYLTGLAVCSKRYHAMEVVFQHYQVDAYYFPSAAPSTSSFPTVDVPRSVIGDDAEASQDSKCHDGSASRAIDGDTNGAWSGGSVTHTCDADNPWWMVDLGREETSITNVVVYNRNDCCQERMGNTDLEILDAAGTVVASQPFEGVEDVYRFRFGNVLGRSVRINRKEWGILNIAEVEVFGHYVAPSAAPSMSSMPTAHEPRNVITDAAIASQDSECHDGIASRAIDGDTNGSWYGGSVTHTCYTATPWWMVDLGREETSITNVVVYNRNDCCQERLGNTDLEILDAAGTVVASQPFEGVEDVYHFAFVDVVGRSVRVNKKQWGEINIAEVEVLGYLVATNPPTTPSPTPEAYRDIAPTTENPTTLTPTTLLPTTAAPTLATATPTTAFPATIAPTTEDPTTLTPTTLLPTTAAPTTVAPTTIAPTTEDPTTSTDACGDGRFKESEDSKRYKKKLDRFKVESIGECNDICADDDACLGTQWKPSANKPCTTLKGKRTKQCDGNSICCERE